MMTFEEKEQRDWYYADVAHEEMMMEKYEKEQEKMERKIIDLNTTNMTVDEIFNLDGYVWKNDKLIPTEMIEGE